MIPPVSLSYQMVANDCRISVFASMLKVIL